MKKINNLIEYEYYPWKTMLDYEGTKTFYNKYDFSVSKEINQSFADILTEEEKNFFDLQGIALDKVKISVIKSENMEEEEEAFDIYFVSYLIKGYLCTIASSQIEIYEDVFGDVFKPEGNVSVVEYNHVEENDFYNMQVVFKPAISTFAFNDESYDMFDEQDFETWNCGYVGVSVVKKVKK